MIADGDRRRLAIGDVGVFRSTAPPGLLRGFAHQYHDSVAPNVPKISMVGEGGRGSRLAPGDLVPMGFVLENLNPKRLSEAFLENLEGPKDPPRP